MSFHAFVDIAISQPCSCFHNNIFTFSSESSFHSKSLIDNDRRLASSFSWKSITSTKKVGKNINFGRIEVHRGGLIIKAVATLEIANIACKNEELKQYGNTLRMDIDSIRSNAYLCESQASGEDPTEVDERKRLRRSIISKANKGNTPWNKGKKHSPETLQRIKERTRIAMQDPKIKMKLVNSGHAQSEETRIKIGVGVRLRWERRREKLMLQETCYYEWKKLIAAASRKGLLGEEELKWDSYNILNKQHEKEWHQSVELRKIMSRPRGSKRAPKSAEQKREIAAAIAAKWADPETCYYEWKKLIAAASRKGLLGEEELQWDSYKILNKQHAKEWHQSVELRKIMSRPNGSKRAPPKSAEQKRKIAAAIAAKWADPETCYYEWKKLIAEASRKGLLGEEELQWDSYNILNKQHEKEWHQSVELRKIVSRPKGSKRAPMSAEQKRKIAAAIVAKWADPQYRDRVCYGLAKYHGIPEGVERNPRKKPSIDGQARKTSTRKKIESDDLAKHETKNQIIRLKKSNTPLYKDPLASSKLEMLNNIRAQRDAAINKKREAISRAKLLIAEAEKAATALEIAAKSSTLAQASLLESRELISEAISFIKLMENEDQVPCDLSESITEPVLQQIHTNTQILSSSDGDSDDLSFHTYALSDTVNENATNSCYGDLVKTGEKSSQTSSDCFLPQKSINNVHCTNATMNLADSKRNPNGIASHGKISLVNGVEKTIQSGKAEGPQKQVNKTKIWVCGRLVEVEEQT